MRIQLTILNPGSAPSHIADPLGATWHSRTKSYETDFYGFDEDIINSPIGHNLDRIILDDVQLTSKSQIEELEKFLENAKKSFKH
jgi:hypothetical protein